MPACHRFFPASFLLALALLPATAGATAFVPLADAALAERAPVIVEGRVLAAELAPGERPAIDYLVAVERSIKGGLPAAMVVVRVPGGVRPDGVGLLVQGAPRFSEGDEALLFLEPRRDGTFGLHQLMLGAFRIEYRAGVRVATRNLVGTRRVALPGRAAVEDGPRDAEAFRRWLEARVAGRDTPAEYFLPAASDAGNEKFATIVSADDPPPFGCGPGNSGHSVRWFDFQLGADVGWRAHFSGQEGLSGGGFGELQTALAAWNDDPNTHIGYVFDGLTAAASGFSTNDGVNAVLFGDPNDEIGGSFDGAGLLALGGPWFLCETLFYHGERYHPILSADVVTQDGLELFFASVPDPSRAAEQLLAHELGHTLGLAHSADPEALMYAEYHHDLRGAALETDDLAGGYHLYAPIPPPTAPPDPPAVLAPPAAPSALTAAEGDAGAVALAWSDNSHDESVFRIERRQNGPFALVTTVAADTTSFVDPWVEPETLYGYRLTAVNGAGDSAATDVEILTGADRRPAAPTNLRAAPLSSTEVRLTWQDNSEDEAGFLVDILIAPEWVEIPVQLPPDTRKLIVEGLPPAADHSFRVRAMNTYGSSAASNDSTTTTFEDDDGCLVTGDELCLLGGRFKVSAAYRNQHAGGATGTGTVVPSTDESGMFWFFDPGNVELIVKALDGRPFNDHYWIFYGALTDLEYDITVTDTVADTAQTYHNAPGEICGRADTSAFPEPPAIPDAAGGPIPLASDTVVDVAGLRLVVPADEPSGSAPAPQATGSCQPGPQNLCLLDRRLRVEVRWHNQYDGVSEGDGYAIADSDNTGMFWFFGIENTELVVKALDGTGFNDQLWIFYGALTDLEYWITVTDTATGDSRVYYNAPGEVCGRADIEAFDAVPPDDPPPGDPDIP